MTKEEIYERFGIEYRNELAISQSAIDIILDAFCNGTPLPKGHRDLVDYEELKNNAREYGAYTKATLSHIKTKIIIEADKEKSDEYSN